jgi:aminobenzoyl-glutamate utilization protein B
MRPQDRPAIELNQDVMARYRPAMRRFYYDPTKYRTYLDQLGIAYPTVRSADGSCAGGATP